MYVCMYVYIFMHANVCGDVHMCEYVNEWQANSGCHFSGHHPCCSFKTGSLIFIWGSLIRPGLSSPRTTDTCHHACFFLRWVLVWQAPSWLSHLLSYKLYSFYKSALTGWVVVHAFSSSACLGGRGRRSELQARLVYRTVRVAPRSPVSKNLKRGYVFLCVLININIMFAIFWNFFELCIKVP